MKYAVEPAYVDILGTREKWKKKWKVSITNAMSGYFIKSSMGFWWTVDILRVVSIHQMSIYAEYICNGSYTVRTADLKRNSLIGRNSLLAPPHFALFTGFDPVLYTLSHVLVHSLCFESVLWVKITRKTECKTTSAAKLKQVGKCSGRGLGTPFVNWKFSSLIIFA